MRQSRIDIEISGTAINRLQELEFERLPDAREALVLDAGRAALTEIVVQNPVDTARSRAAWVAALEQVGGTAPAGWEGPHPSAVAEGRSQGSGEHSQTRDQSEVHATNQVDYVPYLEFGTTQHAPVAMVRRSLLKVRERLAALFHLESGHHS